MMESALFWLELNEDRWCHLPQVIPFQLASELPFLVFLQFCGIGVGDKREKVVDGGGGWRYSGGLSQDGNPLHDCSRCTGMKRWLEGRV